MADVSAIRHTGRPRPLGEVKDDSSYMQLSHRTPIHATGNGFNQDNIITQKVNEMRDSLRTATLINIVAAVNGNNNVESSSQKLLNDSAVSSSTEGLGNTMAVISNLVLTKDRDISIPRPQVFLEAPKKISVKKPVFYKNSQDEVSQNNVEIRRRAVSLTRTRTTIIEENKTVKQERPKSENIQISVSLQQVKEDIKAQRASRDWIDTPAKVRIARSMSPRRRLISLNKKGDSRGTTVLSKCEAVDILDTSDKIQPPTSAKEVKTTETASVEPRLYRARSLPALFPVKRKKDVPVESKPPSSNNPEKPKIIAPFKYPSVRAYGGMPNILCGRTMQVRNETFTDISIPVQKEITEKSTDKIIYQQDIQNRQENYTLSTNDINGSDIKLDGRSIQNPKHVSSTEVQQKRDRLLHKRATELDSKLQLMQDRLLSHNNHYEDLQKTLLLKDISCTDSMSENSVDIANYGLIGKGFKSSLSSARSRAEKMQKAPRKVTFAEKNDDDNEFAPGENNKRSSKTLYEEKIRKLRFLPKRPVSPSRNAFSPVKAKSCGEETRIKRRILPGYYIQEKPKYDVLVNMKISSVKTKSSHQPRPPSRMSDVRSSAVSDTSSYFDDLVHDWNGKDIDATDRTCTNQPVSYGTSSFYTGQNAINIDFNQNDDESYDEDEDDGDDDVRNYRIVKAVDLETLSGFQHRKFKKPTMKREPTATAHFIKIKVKS